jgi:hypothetical protein
VKKRGGERLEEKKKLSKKSDTRRVKNKLRRYNDSFQETEMHFMKNEREFPFVRSGQDAKMVHCTLCNSSLSIGSRRRTAVVEHQQTKKHKASHCPCWFALGHHILQEGRAFPRRIWFSCAGGCLCIPHYVTQS